MRELCIMSIFVLCLVVINSSYAGWFGPSNYDECILDGMKGVNSDVAAKLVAQACRKKFPVNKNSNNVVKLSDDVLSKIDGHARFNSLIRAKALNEEWTPGLNEDISGDIHNNNEDWYISSLVIRIMDKDSDKYKDYNVAVKGNDGGAVPPLSKGGFYFNVYSVTKNWAWDIVGGSGYKK